MRKLLDSIDSDKLKKTTGALALIAVALQYFIDDSWIANIAVSLALASLSVLIFKTAYNLREFVVVIAAMWLPIGVTTIAGVLLFYEGQGRDLGVSLLGEGQTRLFMLFLILIYWAVNNWHSARLGLNRTFQNPTGTEPWLFWSPRLLGVCAHGFAAMSLALASWGMTSLGDGNSAKLKPSDLLVFTAPAAIALVTVSVWAIDYSVISQRPRTSARAAKWARYLRIIAPICVIVLFAGLGYTSYVGALPEGLLPGTIWISASACAFLVAISVRRKTFNPTPVDHHKLTIWLAAIALLAGAWIWYSPTDVGDFLGSLNVCFFAFGAVLAILNLCGWAASFVVDTAIAAERVKFAAATVVFLLLLAALTSLLRDFHLVRLCPDRGCSRAPGGDAWSIKDPDQRPTISAAALAWYEQAERSYHKDGAHKDKPVPMLVIATAGGGIRAAFWTATVLERLQGELKKNGEKLEESIFAISGVSGGSVGAMDYIAALHARQNPRQTSPDEFEPTKFLQSDFLAPAIASLVFVDTPSNFLPDLGQIDRGTALEHTFETGSKGFLGHSFLSFFPDLKSQGQPWRPALLLNATHQETGRRIIASNLKIERDVFLDSFDEFNLLESDMRASTAAHNSARFTYVSPAGKLQKKKEKAKKDSGIFSEGSSRGYIIDGGYFENYGALTALEVARRARSEIEIAKGKGVVKLVVLQISSDPTLTKDRTRVRTTTDDKSNCVLTTAAPADGSSGASNFLHFRDSGLDPDTHRWQKNDGEGRVVSYLNELAAPLLGVTAVREARGTLAAAELAAAVCSEQEAPNSPASSSAQKQARAAIDDLLATTTTSRSAIAKTASPTPAAKAGPHFAHFAMCDTSEIGKAPIVPPLGWVLSKPMRKKFPEILDDCGNAAELTGLVEALN